MVIFSNLQWVCLYLFLFRLSCRGLCWWHKTDRLILLQLECEIVGSSSEHSWWNNCICCIWFLMSLFLLQEFLVQFGSLYLIEVTGCSRNRCRTRLYIHRCILDAFLEFKIRLSTDAIRCNLRIFHWFSTFKAKLQLLPSKRWLISVISLHIFVLGIATTLFCVHRCIKLPSQLQAHLPEFESHRIAVVLIVFLHFLLLFIKSCPLAFWFGFGDTRRRLSVDPAVFAVRRTFPKMLSKIVVICVCHIELLLMVIHLVIFTLTLSFNNLSSFYHLHWNYCSN